MAPIKVGERSDNNSNHLSRSERRKPNSRNESHRCSRAANIDRLATGRQTMRLRRLICVGLLGLLVPLASGLAAASEITTTTATATTTTTTTTTQPKPAMADDVQPRGISRGPDLATDPQQQQQQQLMQPRAEEQRQYFKIHITPGHKNHLEHKKRRHQLQRAAAGAPLRRRAAQGQEVEAQKRGGQGSTGTGTGNNTKPKISNAALKKLLNQALQRAANGSSLASTSTLPKGPNFKFVFIQRATPAAGKGSGSAGHEHEQAPPASGKPEEAKKATSSGGASSSLAASVSKQLASSLLSSAAQLVGAGASSSSPSITSLASKLASGGNQLEPDSGSSGGGGESLKPGDQTTLAVLQANGLDDKMDGKRVEHAPLNSSINAKTRQPSKVYNLPVKFVSNGQPYGVQVFSVIKKHLATIKKLQQLSSGGVDSGRLHSPGDFHPAATGGGGGGGGGPTNAKLREKQQQTLKKLKGANSRLIYLPLRYLSNAKPSRLMVAKGQHHQQHRSSHKAASR